ncbi:MAG: LysM peptidoglycan-binding domain-containing protein [Firmicutes bacterium]|jgi:D-alanyl-D-alanine carboxypeptidase (penicillin-binding protein 5/6)|nr:LysM peptidoglycan-binding domain-containing protein [Bacillota bacterium]
MRRRRRKPTKRLLILALALFLGSSFFLLKPSPNQPEEPQQEAGVDLSVPIVDFAIPLDATSAVLMDADSGQVLFAKDAHRQVAPASLTKMLTALVAVKGWDLDLPIKVSPSAARTGGTRVGLAAGSEIQLESLVWGLLLRSGNDAARAIAQGLAGSEEAFVEQMNRAARRLGANSSNFVNPHGLSAPGHLSTAYDLALIAKALLEEETLARIVRSEEEVVRWGGGKREIKNINRFVREYPGAIGIKTGYTDEAGFCLASAAEQDGRRLIAIVLGCSSSNARYHDSMRLLNQGFANYEYLSTGKGMAKYPTCYHTVEKGQTLSYIARKYNCTEGVLAEANGLKPPYRLEVGQHLVIP